MPSYSDTGRPSPVMKISPDSTERHCQDQMSFMDLLPAKDFPSQDSEGACKTPGQISVCGSSNSPTSSTPNGQSGKMFPEFLVQRTTPSGASLPHWLAQIGPSYIQTSAASKNTGEANPAVASMSGQTAVWFLDLDESQRGESLTANFSPWPNNADVCLLSSILETEVPHKYFLSPRACAGILRRAAKRKKAIPPHLERALQAVASRM